MVISSATSVLLSLVCLAKYSWAFTSPSTRLIQSHLAYSASDLLYEDQQKAKARRAADEQRLLGDNIKPLVARKMKEVPIKRGSGFGAGKRDNRSPAQRLAVQQAKVMTRDGVMRIDNTLDGETCDRMRRHVLRQQELADMETEKNMDLSEDYYGVENRRKHRCDLLLSLMPNEEDEEDITLEVLQKVLGEKGTLRPIYEELVSNDGEFYEFAAVITNPGSDRQQIHPDLPQRKEAPLYVIFLALQDITEAMGPTTFLLGTHTQKERSKFDDHQRKDEQLANANSRLALLNKGDAVLFDARILHCGNANEEEGGSTRAMFNFSFRNPKETGNLGYCGSMRPGYVGKMSLGDVGVALAKHDDGFASPFAKYGDGLSH
mmetsp:Transcript_47354/g.100626  ORF Transcript_47354/g.100626 Transcript_47354/m.100626 type:complete len:376 (-) Transcript_47354:201-1328(-)|eukprot:CAMPEP_0172558622 /NCGR_PEP_ID=MMETSP1067-20121228/79998_1 /TAXON_ID=265564 ORGANISM="Thalassiosira punctigera, Strain Tpunct2005C2" /NCGR_SAMPLE_ID=MMETSP1067 /ASSEMBLY_ACC=CAM_ASM_000444 /LENGTH=375 /DNA_ID=CAMNT_0013348021 /DNA_START=117 /DNA_END=1244 /DNA_ORIENTATION=+